MPPKDGTLIYKCKKLRRALITDLRLLITGYLQSEQATAMTEIDFRHRIRL